MMANPIYDMLNQRGGGNSMLQQFEQFKRNFSGDPRQQIQQLMNSGKITQADYDRAVRMANSMMRLMK